MNLAPVASAAFVPVAAARAVHESLAGAQPESTQYLGLRGLAPQAVPPSNVVLPDLHLPQPGDAGVRKPGPPPARGSDVERGELELLHGLQDHRTPEGDAWAQFMASDGATKVWSNELAGYKLTHTRLEGVRGQVRLTAAMAGTAALSQVDKFRYQRARPFTIDPTLVPVVSKPHDKSYPSGHASVAYAAAAVMSSLIPEQAQAYYDLAAQVALSRVYGGVHFPSDVVAGARLGTSVGTCK
ncbi:MAG: phosphatase PAP2 family protein [Thermoleophilia bacterium]|nr:phosphatase PAP2 family protein [Thermoleophilia bacterium]